MTIRQLAALTLMLVGLGLISITAVSVLHRTRAVPIHVAPVEIQEYTPTKPVSCPLRAMQLQTMDGETWLFLIPSGCSVA